MSIKEIQERLKPRMAQVEELIASALSSDIQLLNSTNRGLREHPGKMLRPMLSLLVAQACGTPGQDSLRFAAAAELLHNSTLLHDDVVDGSTERRGVPTLAKLLNPQAAVLIGDFWLVRCMQTILDASRNSERALRIFASTLGHLAEGELLQMQHASDASATLEIYLRIIYCKTASLFEATAQTAAISVEAPEKVVEAMGAFARKLGIAFQIKDDIFDYAPPSAELGKPVGQDLTEQKITLPLLCALDKADAAKEKEIRTLVSNITDHPENVATVHNFVMEQDGVEAASQVMDQYIREAQECLDVLPASPEKEALLEVACFVGQRGK